MAYPGGKAGAGVYQRIINQIPPHDIYVEPFLGDGAVIRRKLPAARNIGIEIDPEVAAGFHVADVDDAESGDVEIHCCDGIEWLKHAFGLYRIPRSTVAENNGSGRGKDLAGESCDAVPCQGATSNPATAAAACESGGGRHQSAGDAIPHDPTRWFVYCDPPYLMSTRRAGRLYRHEMTDEQHGDLLDVVRRLPCLVMISGYASPLYSTSLEGWRSVSFETMTRGGSVATEWLWMNYPEPTALHDYRYLSDDKRERERITRKVRNWTEGLERLPELERQAIETAITSRRK